LILNNSVGSADQLAKPEHVARVQVPLKPCCLHARRFVRGHQGAPRYVVGVVLGADDGLALGKGENAAFAAKQVDFDVFQQIGECRVCQQVAVHHEVQLAAFGVCQYDYARIAALQLALHLDNDCFQADFELIEKSLSASQRGMRVNDSVFEMRLDFSIWRRN